MNAADSAFDQAGTTRQGIAAALRAAADQVVPEEPAPKGMQASVRQFTHQEWRRYQRQEIRAELLAIATELETINDY
jgi:hypothetical protein